MNDFEKWDMETSQRINKESGIGNEDLKQEVTNLLQSSNYDDDYKSEEEKALWYYDNETLLEMKHNLLMNQPDRIDFGMNYNQTDIKYKLKNI